MGTSIPMKSSPDAGILRFMHGISCSSRPKSFIPSPFQKSTHLVVRSIHSRGRCRRRRNVGQAGALQQPRPERGSVAHRRQSPGHARLLQLPEAEGLDRVDVGNFDLLVVGGRRRRGLVHGRGRHRQLPSIRPRGPCSSVATDGRMSVQGGNKATDSGGEGQRQRGRATELHAIVYIDFQASCEKNTHEFCAWMRATSSSCYARC